ncbi:MAG: diaminopimelate decarboxylase, partial [Pseudomonadota bacterium]|nr:diaminopimelate decarboxylase [Pseudomonadota bacterium]
MTEFSYQNQILHCEKLALSEIAKEFGTPSYVYSRQAISDAYLSYDQAFGDWPHQICYAVKANSNIAVLNVLAKLGAGFDIVSIGELKRVISAGGDPSKSIFSGVGKLDEEIQQALELGIGCFNVESEAELHRIADIAQLLEKPAPISLRVNPDVDPQTHPYISTGLQENKFGIPMEDAPRLYAFAQQ